jgi:FkbM family methyltransferase
LDQVLWNCEPFTAKVMAQLAPQVNQFIDVGANRGFYALLVKAINPGISVLAFEPEPEVFKKLERNLNLNSFKSMYCHNVALGEISAKRDLYTYSDGNDGMHTLAPVTLRGTMSQIVQVRPLDDYLLDGADYLASSLVKIDVEGSEDEVLLGGSKLLKRNPIMIIELNEYMRNKSISFTSPKEKSTSLENPAKQLERKSGAKFRLDNIFNWGYKCFWIDEREKLVSVNSTEDLPHHAVLGKNHGANYLFIPRDFILPQKLSVFMI